MRWLNKPLPCAAALLSVALLPSSQVYVRAAPTPQAPGEPTDGATSVPVDATPGNPSVAHPGAPTVVAGRQETLNGVGVPAENTAVTYDDGLYTPWTPTDGATPTAVVTAENTAVASDSWVYLQSSATSEQVLGETSIPVVTTSDAVMESSTLESSSTIPTTTSSSSSPSTSTSTSTSSTSSAPSTPSTSSLPRSSSSSSRSSSSKAGILDAARETSTTASTASNTTKMGVILPVVLSLAALALILSGIAFLVWRRRVAKRRGLAARRYGDTFAEKGGGDDDGDDFDDGAKLSEKAPESWQTFTRYSTGPYDGIESGMAGAGVRSLQTPQPNDDDPNSFRPKESRRPLPMTPQQVPAEYSSMPTLDSTPHDLDSMIVQSRTGYAVYADRPQRNKSIMSDIAGSIYSSLSLRSKRSRTGKYSIPDNEEGHWDEHGAWQPIQEDQPARHAAAPLYWPKQEEEYPAGSAQDRPLLSAVDETPRKKGYSTYSPPESPSRNTPGGGNAYGETRIAPPARGHALQDNPVPSYSPYSPKRTRSSATARSEIAPDTPSIYSVTTCEAMSTASPASNYPDTLQPGRSPALGRGVTPPLPSQKLGKGALYRQKSGTTYSLGGVAGLLYNEQEQSSPPMRQNPYTSIPPRKPRKQSILSQYKPRTAASPLSDEASAGQIDVPNPHRAVSAVVRASRARGSSVDSHYSSEFHSKPQWKHNSRYKLGQSQASTDSIDDLLSNVLGPSRSPA